MSEVDYFEKYQALHREYAQMKKKLAKADEEQRKAQVRAQYETEKSKRELTRGISLPLASSSDDPAASSAQNSMRGVLRPYTTAGANGRVEKEQQELIKSMQEERAKLQAELRKARQAERLAHIGATHVGNVRPPTSTIPRPLTTTGLHNRPRSAGAKGASSGLKPTSSIASRGIRLAPAAESLQTESSEIFPNATHGEPLGDHREIVQNLLNRIEEHLPSTFDASKVDDTSDSLNQYREPSATRGVSGLDSYSNQMVNFTSQNATSTANDSVTTSEVVALRRELRESRAKVAILQSHFDNLQLSFEAEKDVQTFALKQYEDVKELLQESRRTCIELQRQVQKYELDQEQLETYKQMVKDYKLDTEALRAELTALRDERIADVAADKAQMKRLMIDKTEKEAQNKATITHLTAENEQLKQEVKVRVEQLAVRSHELEEVKKKLSEAEERYSKAAKQLEDAQNKLSMVTASTGIEPSEMSEALEIVRLKRQSNANPILSRGINLGGSAENAIESKKDQGVREEETIPSLRKKVSMLEAKLRDALSDQKSERMLRLSTERLLSEAKDQIKILGMKVAEQPSHAASSTTRGVSLTSQQSSDLGDSAESVGDKALNDSSRLELDSLFEFDPASEHDIDVLSSAVADRSAQNSEPASNVFALRITEARLSPNYFAKECLTFLSVAAMGLRPDVSTPVGGREPKFDFIMQVTMPHSKLAASLTTQFAEISLYLHKGGAASQVMAVARVPLSLLYVNAPSTKFPLYAPEVSERKHGVCELFSQDGSNTVCGQIVYDMRLLYPVYSPGIFKSLTNASSTIPNTSVTVPSALSEPEVLNRQGEAANHSTEKKVNCVNLVDFASAIVPPSSEHTRLAVILRIREVVGGPSHRVKASSLSVKASLAKSGLSDASSTEGLTCIPMEEYTSALVSKGVIVEGLAESSSIGSSFIAIFEVRPGTQLAANDELTFSVFDEAGKQLGSFDFPFVLHLGGGMTGYVKNLLASLQEVRITYDAAAVFVPNSV